MERTILQLLGLTQPELMAVISRYRRSALEVEKDVDVRKLIQVRDAVEESLHFIMGATNLGKNLASAAILMQFLSTEREAEVVMTLNQWLSLEQAPTVQFGALKFLAVSRHRLPDTVKVALGKPLLSLMKPCKPLNAIGLYARDILYAIILGLARTRNLLDFGELLVEALDIERSWIKAHSESLYLALAQVKENLAVSLRSWSPREGALEATNKSVVEELSLESTSAATEQSEVNLALMIEVIGRRSFEAQSLETDLELLQGGDTELADAMAALVRISLIFGRRNEGEAQTTLLRRFGEVALRLLNDAKVPPPHQRIAAALLREALGQKTDEAALARLLPLLEERRDGISLAAVDLIAEGAYESPAYCLGRLDLLLSAKDRHKRENASQVLARIVELRALHRNEWRTPSSVDDALSDLLLNRLGDPLVDLRNASARAFSFLNPRRVVAGLSAVLGDKSDEKRRAAAREALRAMARDSEDVVGFTEAIVSLEAVSDQENVFALGATLVEAMLSMVRGEDRLDEFTSVLIRVCMERGHEKPLLMGLARRIGPIISHDSTRCERYCLKVLTELQRATDANVLTFLAPVLLLRVLPLIDIANGDVRKSAFSALETVVRTEKLGRDVRRVACECLARFPGAAPWALFLPLVSSYDSEGADAELARCALYGMCHLLMLRIQDQDFSIEAFPPIASSMVIECARKVLDSSALVHDSENAAKLIAGAQEFITLALVTEGFSRWDDVGKRVEEESTASIAPTMTETMFKIHSASLEQGGANKVTEVSSQIKTSTKLDISVSSNRDELVKVSEQSPLKSTLASTITAAKRPLVEVIDSVEPEAEKRSNAQSLDTFTISLVIRKLAEDDAVLHPFCSSALCSVARALLVASSPPSPEEGASMLSMAGSALKSARIAPERAISASQGLARLLTEELISLWSKDRPPQDEEASVLFNVAFACVRSGRSFLRPVQLVSLVNACLSMAQNPGARKTHALKLLGLLLVLPEKDAVALEGGGTLGRIEAALRGVANVDPNQEARALASSLLAATFERL